MYRVVHNGRQCEGVQTGGPNFFNVLKLTNQKKTKVTCLLHHVYCIKIDQSLMSDGKIASAFSFRSF